jgi:hypothetical protein
MNRLLYILTLITAVVSVSFSENADSVNDIEHDGRSSKSDDMLWDMLENCVSREVESVSTCLKVKVRNYLF